MSYLDLYILLPPLLFVLGRMAFYIIASALGREMPFDDHMASRGSTAIFGSMVRQAWAYAVNPIGNLLAALKLTPNMLTALCFLVTAAGGVLIGLGHVSLGGSIGVLGAGLDYFDGYLARRFGTSSNAGAFLDSTLDRYGEMFFFGGASVFFRNNVWLLVACLVTLGSGVVVSYARAKAEAFGYPLRGGLMQRTERVIVFCAAAVFGPYIDAALPPNAIGGVTVFGVVMVTLAILTTKTAIARILNGFNGLSDGSL